MVAVKDPDCRWDQAIGRMIRQYQKPLLRLCYIQLRDYSSIGCRRTLEAFDPDVERGRFL